MDLSDLFGFADDNTFHLDVNFPMHSMRLLSCYPSMHIRISKLLPRADPACELDIGLRKRKNLKLTSRTLVRLMQNLDIFNSLGLV